MALMGVLKITLFLYLYTYNNQKASNSKHSSFIYTLLEIFNNTKGLVFGIAVSDLCKD